MLLTAREQEKRKQEGTAQKKIEPLVVETNSCPVRKVVRMFHPDSTDKSPLSCEFTIAGETIKLVRGVAEVPDDLASVLLQSGWILGKRLDKEWE